MGFSHVFLLLHKSNVCVELRVGWSNNKQVYEQHQPAIPRLSIDLTPLDSGQVSGSTAHWLQISPAQPEYKPIRAGQGRCGVTSYLSLSLSLWLSTNGIIPASFDSARIVTSRWRSEVDPILIPDALRWYSWLMLFINLFNVSNSRMVISS